MALPRAISFLLPRIRIETDFLCDDVPMIKETALTISLIERENNVDNWRRLWLHEFWQLPPRNVKDQIEKVFDVGISIPGA